MLINVNMLIFDSKHEKVVFLLIASYRMPDFTPKKDTRKAIRQTVNMCSGQTKGSFLDERKRSFSGQTQSVSRRTQSLPYGKK